MDELFSSKIWMKYIQWMKQPKMLAGLDWFRELGKK
jgi:hypothetical protein